MLDFNSPTRVAFISSYPPGVCPIADFTAHLAESMAPAAYESFEPVIVALHADVTREYPDEVNFVIRRDFRSDYAEAAKFINAGYGDVVIAQHNFDLFGGRGGSFFTDLIRQLEVPVITVLHDVPQDLPPCQLQTLNEMCADSVKLVVMDKQSCERLNRHYRVGLEKIEMIYVERTEYPFDRQLEWFHIGRQFRRLISEQLHQYAGNIRSMQAVREQALLFEQ